MMTDMPTSTTISRKLAVASVFAASYLPPLVGFICGVGHCEVCRQSWFKVVGIVQGIIVAQLLDHLLDLPRIDIDSFVGIWLAIAIQIGWLFGWTWLAMKGKIWLAIATIVALALTVWFTLVINALIRM